MQLNFTRTITPCVFKHLNTSSQIKSYLVCISQCLNVKGNIFRWKGSWNGLDWITGFLDSNYTFVAFVHEECVIGKLTHLNPKD